MQPLAFVKEACLSGPVFKTPGIYTKCTHQITHGVYFIDFKKRGWALVEFYLLLLLFFHYLLLSLFPQIYGLAIKSSEITLKW